MTRVGVGFTWWGHSSGTVGVGRARVALDPLFTRRLFHLRRHQPDPGDACLAADVVVVSHLHFDHLHVPSLARFAADVPLVVPRGAETLVRGLPHVVHTVEPGDVVTVGGVRVEVLPAHHSGQRMVRSRLVAPALGFRLSADGVSAWFPGDTGLFGQLHDVAPVDLAVVPVGGWGPTLGEEHLDPDQATEAVRRVGARFAVPVHYGTYWPLGLELARRTRRRLLHQPGVRFGATMREAMPAVGVEVPAPGVEVAW